MTGVQSALPIFGRPEQAKKQYDLVEFIGELNAINKVLYNRELALFYADHDMKLKDALTLAQKELEVRHDVYTWDTPDQYVDVTTVPPGTYDLVEETNPNGALLVAGSPKTCAVTQLQLTADSVKAISSQSSVTCPT